MKHLLSIVIGVFIVATLLTIIATLRYVVNKYPKELSFVALVVLFMLISYLVGVTVVEMLV